MMSAAIAGDTAPPDRILRFEDLLINAAAVPLPIELTPSLLAQPAADSLAAPGANPDPHASSTDPMPAQPPDQSAANAEHGKSGPETTPDPVLKSLQAALDAIHDSLRPDVSAASGNAGHSMGASAPGMDASNLAGALAHAADTQPVATSLGEVGALHDLQAAPLANFDLANVVSGLLADHSPEPDVSGAVAGPFIGDALSDVSKVANAVSSLVHQTQPALSDLAAAAVHDVANPAAPALTNAATAPGATAPGVAPATAEAVTVPSLHGAGLDALAGLLQPAIPAAPDAAHAAAGAAPAGFEDLSMHAPIGLDDIVHHDAAASNAAHAAMPPAGSGLI
jgi:hypothetical protein